VAIGKRLDNVIADQFQHDEQAKSRQRVQPIVGGKLNECHADRQHGGDNRPNVRNESQYGRQQPPGERVVDTDHLQPERHAQAKPAVHQPVHQQVAADSGADFVQRSCCKRKPVSG
jgi:hypothetical protein